MSNRLDLFFGFVLIFTVPAYAGTAKPQSSYTLDNLSFAYAEEMSMSGRYSDFAEKADAEGYPFLGSLFRAVAKSEEAHAENHATAIKKMGGTPKAFSMRAPVRSTAENLSLARSDEFFQWHKVYSPFITQAQSEEMFEAARTFRYAMQSENQHARLFDQVSQNPPDWKIARRPFYVSPECGYVAGTLPREVCPVCGEPKARFIKII